MDRYRSVIAELDRIGEVSCSESAVVCKDPQASPVGTPSAIWEVNTKPFLLGSFGKERHDSIEKYGQFKVQYFERQLSGLDLGEVENIVE